jgi:MFS family permease
MTEGFRYVAGRPDIRAALLVFLLIGTLGANFPIFISTMAVSVFRMGADGYGLLSSAMAIGAVTGSLLAARRERPTMALIGIAAAAFGAGCTLAAVMPDYLLFGLMLVPVGIAAQTLTTSCFSLIQLATDRAMRGRVMAIVMAVAVGGTPFGAPFVGRIADRFGPRWALGVGAAAGFAAALVAATAVRSARLRARPTDDAALAAVEEKADLAGL